MHRVIEVLGHEVRQGEEGDNDRDNHEVVEHIAQLPDEVVGHHRAEEDEDEREDGVDEAALLAEEVSNVDLTEEVPAEDGGEGEEHQADGHEQAAGGIAHDAGEGDLRHVGLADALGGAGGKDAVAGIQGGDHDQCGHGENDKGIDEYTDHGDNALLVGAAALCHGVGVRGGAHAGLITEKAALDALADGLREGKAEAAADDGLRLERIAEDHTEGFRDEADAGDEHRKSSDDVKAGHDGNDFFRPGGDTVAAAE